MILVLFRMIGIKKAGEELNVNSETLGHWVRLETKPLSCNQCGYKAERISKLKKHEKTHLAIDPNKEAQLKFSCDECSKDFVSNETLKRHKNKHQRHEESHSSTEVNVMGKQFDFPCYICSTSFQFMKTLKRHEKKHSDYNMKGINKTEVNAAKDDSFNAINIDLIADDENEEDNFVGNENIKKKEILSEEPELKEQTYDIGINTKCEDLFDPHELISTDPAPNHKSPKKAIFTCSHCGLTYKRKDSLEDHMKAKHRDGIMLQCSPCEKEFASKNAMKKHIESKHEGKRYKCQHCTHEATQQINLKTHIRKKHNLDIMMSECPK